MQPISAPLTSDAQAYSQGYKHNGFIFSAGQVGIHKEDGSLAEGIAEQTRVALSNLSDLLKSGNSSLDRVLRMTCILADMGSFDEFDRVYREVFAGHKPARVTVSATLGEGLLVEVDAIAAEAE